MVGPTGSGKSTLINLLTAFWEPDKGKILVDDCPIGQLDLESYRLDLSVVSQDTYIFNTSVRENLRIADADASDLQLEKILNEVGLHHLAVRLDMVLGSQGMKLSGGERQLFALARSLLKKSNVWIFDELSANMDAETERKVLSKLWDTLNGRTLLMVTHRLLDMEKMDQILVIHEGRIIEMGNHLALLRANGLYCKMYSRQMELFGG